MLKSIGKFWLAVLPGLLMIGSLDLAIPAHSTPKQNPQTPREESPIKPDLSTPVPRNHPQKPPPTTRPLIPAMLESIFQRLRREVEPLATRTTSGPLCLITPGLLEDRYFIWSDRPIFLWQGGMGVVTLATSTNEVIWSQEMTDPQQLMIYDGETQLTPGQFYQWQVYRNGMPKSLVHFEVMPNAERERISADLQKIEARLPHASPLEMNLQFAKYFARAGRWSDALQMIYTIGSPNQDVVAYQIAIAQYLCSSHNTSTAQLEQ